MGDRKFTYVAPHMQTYSSIYCMYHLKRIDFWTLRMIRSGPALMTSQDPCTPALAALTSIDDIMYTVFVLIKRKI